MAMQSWDEMVPEVLDHIFALNVRLDAAVLAVNAGQVRRELDGHLVYPGAPLNVEQVAAVEAMIEAEPGQVARLNDCGRQRLAQAHYAKEAGGTAEPDPDEPPCGYTHADHMSTWKSWKDDCVGESGCGFGIMDVDQCWRGHPDDGTTACGGCGHGEVSGEGAHTRDELAALWRQRRAEWLREAIEDMASLYGESKWLLGALGPKQHERRERYQRARDRRQAALERLTHALADMVINHDNYPPHLTEDNQ